ncbi:hypothetical protein QAD02_016991 [Eretmocerus hayati]|uniref:Uncharacterized protein n=1 Tax=Eretmocerus hayati TaxID=131215 RepID=A0ACC2PC59_9HYME|nr:hypothetical protein QAD02_016991 [Eretmocerus hayati]
MQSAWKLCCSGVPKRWIFALMTFFGIWLGNSIRVILSITITEMVPPKRSEFRSMVVMQENSGDHIPKNFTVPRDDIYDWDEHTQGIILSSYFWGYAAMQFPMGPLSERFGGKHLLGIGIFIPSLLTFLTPLSIQYAQSTALIVLRVIMGIVAGSMYPAVSTMIPKWTAPAERTKIASLILGGGTIGTVFGTTLPAMIIHYTGMGWSAVFYFFGTIGLLWYPLWLLLCTDKPEDHPCISETELKYLQDGCTLQKGPKSAPWSQIFRSTQFWAFVMGMVGNDWAYFLCANDLPKYFSSVVGFSIEHNGYLSALPYLGSWFISMLSCCLSDFILEKKWLSLTNTRKFFATGAIMGPAVFIMAASYAGYNQLLVVILFITGTSLMGCTYPSIMIAPFDISPNYAGTIMATGNGIAAVGGIFTPYFVGVLTPNQTLHEWRKVFSIGFVIGVITNVYYLIFAQAEVQEWNDPNFQKKNKNSPDVEKAGQIKTLDECARF